MTILTCLRNAGFCKFEVQLVIKFKCNVNKKNTIFNNKHSEKRCICINVFTLTGNYHRINAFNGIQYHTRMVRAPIELKALSL